MKESWKEVYCRANLETMPGSAATARMNWRGSADHPSADRAIWF
jgi:hypothetical protein